MHPHCRVVRFAGTNTRESHQLSVCVPLSNDRVRVIYIDREVEVDWQELHTSLPVNLENMNKAYVLHVFGRDRVALFTKFPAYKEVRAYLFRTTPYTVMVT